MEGPETKFFVGLSLLPGIGPVRLTRLIERAGSAEAAWHAGRDVLRAGGVDEKSIPAVMERRQRLNLEHEIDRVHRSGARVLTFNDAEYPELLRETYNRPAILYVLGAITPEDKQSLAIVGTRRPSMYGKALAAKVTPRLVESGLTIVSGLATGIDTIAHRAAIQGGGRTIAVLGSGLDVIYPAANRALAMKIRDCGAVVTEYPMGTQPDAFNFPARNRIISGMSLGSLIVEAGERSGALITAKYALEQNREVFAFPGRIDDPNSVGCNELIKHGAAKLVNKVEDVLDELSLVNAPRQITLPQAVAENEIESKIIPLLSAQPVHVDDLGRQTDLASSDVTSALTMLELRGVIRHVGSMHYVLSR